MSENTFEISAASLGYSLEKNSDGSYVDSYLNAAYLINRKINTRTQSRCNFNDLREIAYNMKVVGCQMSNVMFNLKQTWHEKSELFHELQELWDSVNKPLPPKVGE